MKYVKYIERIKQFGYPYATVFPGLIFMEKFFHHSMNFPLSRRFSSSSCKCRWRSLAM